MILFFVCLYLKPSEFDVDKKYVEQDLSRDLNVNMAGFDDATDVVNKARQKHALAAGLSFRLLFIN